MFLQEIDIISQIYSLLGIDPDPELTIIVVFLAGITILMLFRYTLSMLGEGLFGAYK